MSWAPNNAGRNGTRPAPRSQVAMLLACAGGLASILAGPTLLAACRLPAGAWEVLLAIAVAYALHVVVGGDADFTRGNPGRSIRVRLLSFTAILLALARLPPVLHGIEGLGEDLAWVAVYGAIAFRFALDGTGRTSVIDGIGRFIARAIPVGPPPPPGPRRQVTLLAYHYPPHMQIGAARPHQFARHLRRAGWDVQVVTSNVCVRHADEQLTLADQERPAPMRVPDQATAGARVWSRALHWFEAFVLPYEDRLGWLPHALHAGARTMTAHSVLISTHPPVVTHLAALILKLRTGRPWIADFRDPLWGNPCRVALRATWFDPLIERAVVLGADAIIATTESSAAQLQARYPGRAHAISAIYNGYDPDDVIVPAPAPARAVRTLSHVGTLYGGRSPGSLLASFDRLVRDGRVGAWQFRQIGRAVPGTVPPATPGAGVYQSPCHLPHWAARQEMLAADVLLLLDMCDVNPGLQVPAKLYEYVRTGRPILALTPPGSAATQVLAIAAVPHVCIDPAAAPHVFDDALAAFLGASHPVAAPSPAFMDAFDVSHQVRDLVAVLDKLATPPLVQPSSLGHTVLGGRHQCAD